MASCHRFAARACKILRQLARKWDIDVPVMPDEKKEKQDEHPNENEKEKQEDNESFCQEARPSSISLNQFCTDVGDEDMMRGIGVPGEEENPLFWPFPMQGRPLMAYMGDSLEKAGFERLRE